MDISQQILFFFSALGAFNGFLLSMYFLFVIQPRRSEHKYLGGLLLFLSIRIGKSTFLHFNHDLSRDFLQFGLTACFLIGPALYLYCKSVIGKKIEKVEIAIIALLLLSALGYSFAHTYEAEPQLWRSIIVRVIYNQWLVFVLLSGFTIRGVLSKITSKQKLASQELLLVNVYIGVSIIWLAYYTSSFTSYIVGAISFSFILYLSLLLFFLRSKNAKTTKSDKYGKRRIETKTASKLTARLEQLMAVDQVFTDSTLTLKKLAGILSIQPHLLSQFLNDNMGKSFNQFVNEYRIKGAQKLLVDEPQLKIQAIAEMAGFNSNSTFYTAFKKETGQTPAEWTKLQK